LNINSSHLLIASCRGTVYARLQWFLMAISRLVLASRSVSRASLLRGFGYCFESINPIYRDPLKPIGDGNLSPGEIAIKLAQNKIYSLLHNNALNVNIHPQAVILTADTVIVDARGELLGQPHDRADAASMLRTLINHDHQAVTAICLASLDQPDRVESVTDAAQVHLGCVPDQELTRYLESGRWRGKAGGYDLLELRDRWPFTVEGDWTTVVGLPMKCLVDRLARRSILPENPPEHRW
jgi:septum formation protein